MGLCRNQSARWSGSLFGPASALRELGWLTVRPFDVKPFLVSVVKPPSHMRATTQRVSGMRPRGLLSSTRGIGARPWCSAIDHADGDGRFLFTRCQWSCTMLLWGILAGIFLGSVVIVVFGDRKGDKHFRDCQNYLKRNAVRA